MLNSMGYLHTDLSSSHSNPLSISVVEGLKRMIIENLGSDNGITVITYDAVREQKS